MSMVVPSLVNAWAPRSPHLHRTLQGRTSAATTLGRVKVRGAGGFGGSKKSNQAGQAARRHAQHALHRKPSLPRSAAGGAHASRCQLSSWAAGLGSRAKALGGRPWCIRGAALPAPPCPPACRASRCPSRRSRPPGGCAAAGRSKARWRGSLSWCWSGSTLAIWIFSSKYPVRLCRRAWRAHTCCEPAGSDTARARSTTAHGFACFGGRAHAYVPDWPVSRSARLGSWLRGWHRTACHFALHALGMVSSEVCFAQLVA
jgi:hypothetical protein